MIASKKVNRFLAAATVFGAAILTQPAYAHFMWNEVSEGNPPVAKVSFAEGPGEISDGNLVEKVVPAQVWNADGKPLVLKTAGAVRTGSLEGARSFGTSLNYGVLDKAAEGRGVFKLMYFAKSAATLGDAGQSVKLPFEFFARNDGNNGVIATLKRGTELVAKTTVSVNEPGEEKPRTLTTDDKGEIRFEAKNPGMYGLRAAWVQETPGEQDGKKYPQVRNYTTLSFRVAAATTADKPAVPQSGAASMGQGRARLPVGPNPNADKTAYALLEGAHNNRQTMPDNFAGFTAKVMYKKDGVVSNGTVTYRRQGKTEIEFPGLAKEEFSWVQDKMLNMIGHRRGGTFAEGDGRQPLSLGKLPVNNFGQLIQLNDGMKSEYRVKDNKVTEVTREAGGMRFTISVIETMEADAGKYLANHFIVSYRDAKTGNLQMVEGYRDNYAKIDGVWLPTMRFVFTSDAIKPGEADTASLQIIKLTDIKLLEPATLAATSEAKPETNN